LIGIAAVHHVHDLEIWRQLTGVAELADHGAVQFGLVDLASDVPRARHVSVRVRVRLEDVLVGTLRDADCPADAEIGDFPDRLQIVVEHLVTEVRAVGDPDIALAVDLHAVRQVKLAKPLAGFLAACLGQETALRVVFHDAVVAVAVGDEDVALRIPTHIGRTAEDIFLRRRIGAGARSHRAADGRRPAAKHHQHLAVGAEFRDHVGAFVHGPDVVLGIDPDGVGELETVIAFADLLEEIAVLVELPELRGRSAAVIDEDVALRVRRHCDGFPEILSRWRLQEVGYRGEGDFRYVLDRRLQLRGRRSDANHQGNGAGRDQVTLHWSLPGLSADGFLFAKNAAEDRPRPYTKRSLGSIWGGAAIGSENAGFLGGCGEVWTELIGVAALMNAFGQLHPGSRNRQIG